MAEFVTLAKSKADQARVPLVVAVAATHQEARQLAQDTGVLLGNAVILSVPSSAAQDLRFLNEISRTDLVPRTHVFPPRDNTRMQPQNILGREQVSNYTSMWVNLAGSLDPQHGADVQRELTSVTQTFDIAASAWGQAQQENQQQQKIGSPTRQDAAPSNNNNNNYSNTVVSSIPSSGAAPSSVAMVKKPTTTTAPAATGGEDDVPPKISSSNAGTDPSAIRIIPKVHIRLHSSASPSAELPYVTPQPRNSGLPAIRRIIAKAAEKTFGDNFLFVQGNSNVKVRIADEGALIAQDVCHGSDLYVCPVAPPAPQTASFSSSRAAATTATTTTTATTATTTKTSQDAAPTTATAGGKLRIKITYPDGESEVVSDAFTGNSKASDVHNYIRNKFGDSRNFYLQLPQRRIKDDELDLTLTQLNLRGAVAIRVYDVDAMRQRANEYDQEVASSPAPSAPGTTTATGGGGGGLLSSLMSRFGSGSSASNANPHPDAAAAATTSTAAAHRGPPRSMAELRQQQEEEEKRKKAQQGGRPGGNEYYGGAGTNTQAPPPDDE